MVVVIPVRVASRLYAALQRALCVYVCFSVLLSSRVCVFLRRCLLYFLFAFSFSWISVLRSSFLLKEKKRTDCSFSFSVNLIVTLRGPFLSSRFVDCPCLRSHVIHLRPLYLHQLLVLLAGFRFLTLFVFLYWFATEASSLKKKKKLAFLFFL
jgi:hypothetical protein